MSQNNGGNGSGYHPRRGHRSQQSFGGPGPQYVSDYNAAAAAAAAAANPYMYPGYYPPQYYAQPPAAYAPGYPQPVPQDYAQSHHISITNANGERVDLTRLHGQTPKTPNAQLSRPAIATPKSASASASASAPVSVPISSSASTASPATPKAHQRNQSINSVTSSTSLSAVEEFKKKILAKAEAAKKASEGKPVGEAASATNTTTTTTPTSIESQKEEGNAKPETKTVPPVEKEQNKEDTPEEIKEKVTTVQESVSETAQEQTPSLEKKAEEPKKEEVSTAGLGAESSKSEEPITAVSPVELKQHIPVVGTEENSAEISNQDSSATPLAKIDDAVNSEAKSVTVASTVETIQEVPETKAEEEQIEGSTTTLTATAEDGSPSISEFLRRVENATPIGDPFHFNYPSDFKGPDPKLATSKLVKYDPAFLIQFADKAKFRSDEDFRIKTKFIVINEKRGGSDRSGSRGGLGNNFNFGKGSITGIQGSQFSNRSSSSRLKNFDLNSRSNSRQNSKRKGGSGRGERKSNRNRDQNQNENREPEQPSEPVKPLEKSANRWIPKSRAAKSQEVKYAPDGVTVILSQDDVKKRVNSLLNKLTLEFFDTITDEIIGIADQSRWEDNAETLKYVLELIFAKACDEPHWCSVYAQLCGKLTKNINPEIKASNDGENENGAALEGQKLARRCLIVRCQQEYEKGWNDQLPTGEDGNAIEPELMSDEYYRIAAAKRRGLGLVKFIGYLFTYGLLNQRIILMCLTELTKNTEDPSEDTVESLIQMLMTVGPQFDAQEQGRLFLKTIFAKIQEIIKAKKVSSRLLFKLMDIVDLRRSGWRGAEQDNGPKTITEIHEEEQMKAAEAEKSKRRNDDRSQSNRRGARNESRSNSSRNSSGWGSKVSQSDMKSVGVVRNSNSSSNLGPTNNFTRSKSSKGTFKQTPASTNPQQITGESKRAENSGTNMFAALSEGDHHEDDEEEVTVPETEELEIDAEEANGEAEESQERDITENHEEN